MSEQRVTLTKQRRSISQTICDDVMGRTRFDVERAPMIRASIMTAIYDVYRYPLASIVLNVPATWWQHFKETLSRRWPRLFGRLRIRYVQHRMTADDEYPSLPPMPALGEPQRILTHQASPIAVRK